MPFYRTQRDAVDKADQVELVLTIPSFAAGENTVAPDQEMKSNEAREIKNWDIDSLGAMVRANGCTKVATAYGGYDTNTKLLIHFNGADEATSHTAKTGQTVTFVGTGKIDSAQSVFGGTSLFLDGNSDSATVPDAADWNFGASAFTIDTRVRFAVLPSDGNAMVLMGQYASATSYWKLQVKNTTGTYSIQVVFYDGADRTVTVNSTGISADTWYHIAVVRSGNSWYFFQDGVLQGAAQTNSNSMPNVAAALDMGQQASGSYVNGWMDEVRVSLSARWTAGFTVPPVEYDNLSGQVDLAAHHFEGTSTYGMYVINGDLVRKSSSYFYPDHYSDVGAFTADAICHAVSAANALWITNTTDGLKRKAIAAAVAAPASVPATHSSRIVEHNFRLVAEGNSAKTVYGSRAGTGNWVASDAWTASNDAWSIVMPDLTQGIVPGFPSGNDVTVFTKFDTYVVYNQPNVARRRIINGVGSWNGFTVAKGNEGIYFFSTYPTIGVFLWDGNQFINLTAKHDFQDKVNLLQRMFGVYKNSRYYFIYNETGSGVTTPNRVKIYDARFGRWWTRELNSAVADALGYPCLLTKDNNELYVGSSLYPSVYELDDSTTSDNGNNTEASYTTKTFTSKDFGMTTDHVRMKLLKTVLTYQAPAETISIAWTADRGMRNGAQSFDLTSSGDLINSTFTIGTSSIVASSPVRTVAKSFANGATGREFSFQITDRGYLGKAQVRQLRLTACALEDY